uniref:DNA cytosine methyltransferase n=1 Tax=Candidatus Limisoma sp. TaxID=3076476 RepID=UPI0040277090
MLRSIKENEAAVAEAQRVVDAWKAIVGEKSRREEAAKAEAERIATEKAEAERKAAEERERAEKEEEARVEAERKAEEAESDKEEAEKRMDDEEPKPLGSGVFGNIYNQFKGKVKEAFDFLMKHKGGDLLGVFHRKDVGDIDLVWGDENGGLAHILNKHVGEGKSFANVDEAMSHIQNIIETGKNDFEDGDKIVFRKGSELVTVRKNFREGGKKIADKNWVLTAYDKEAADNGNRVTTKVIEGKATPHTASIDKGSEKPEKKQEKQSVFDKAKEIADKEEKKRKAEADKPKQKPLTEAERKDAEEVAGALGYRVEWVDTMEENGTIDADKKVIRIAKDAENPLVQVLGHEVAHGVKRMDGGKFKALQKAAMEVVGEKEWNERIEKKRKLNAYAEGKLAEEVTCDIVGEALNDKDALKRLAESLRGERGILARLRDAVAKMVEYFKNRGDKEGVRRMKAADRLLAEFESALKEGEGVNRSAREAENEAEERELRDNLVERMRKGGLDVVTDSEEMQRVIDTENERTRNMFVGEKGATEADKAEEVSTRLDNLSVARRMEEAEKDAKAIKMATGWERGSDGKWRYETSDIKPKPFEEWMNKKNLKLGDIIDSDSGLFEMYPELKDFKVTRGKGKSTNAAIYTGLGKIEINFSKFKPYMSIPSNREKIDGILHRVINHEIQHAIQDSEGFAQGVSPNAFRPDAPIGKLREMEEADGRMVERYNAMSYTEKALGEGVRLKERILENRKEYNALASKYRFGMDGYTRAAGEVEARNTEKRIGMTEEERRASLASETEDVAREDQILLGVDNADGEMNTGSVREHRVYHGSGADFDAFDHSHMGEGEGAQAYGWGTYVTEVEGIGRTYAIQNTTKHNDALRALQHDVDAISDQLNRHRDDLKYDEEQLKRANEWRAEAELDYELFKDEAEELKEKYGESSPEYRNHLFNDIYTDEMKRAQRSVKSTEESIQYRKEKIAELEKALKDKQAEIDELPKEFPRHLYTVEIPDDNGSNYLDWNGHPAESLLKDVGSFLESEGFERVQDSPVRYEKGESTVVLNPNATGADLYAELQEALGSDKKASQALAELGCIGIKYPADNMRGGHEDGAKNYVIFNENDAKITDHTRFLRTAGGEVYGLVKDGRIYLDPKVATSETAVHEYTHLWGDMLRRKDSEQWSHTVKELKNSVLWEEVKELYPELKTDDEIADEVLSTFSGRRGAERLREEARRVADGEGGVFTKAKAIETLERVKEAIARFWEGVARMFGINRYRSAEELADMAMKDLLDSKNPMKDESGMRKRGEVGETLATSGTYFSGGGLLEAGLKGVIDPKVAVEFSEKIAGVYADNHGNHIVVADVRDVDPKKLVGAVDGGEVQYFHASPVCKNFSKAKREGGEVELDKETALSTAEFIAKTRPKVVTIENVKGYRNSEALKIITDELTRQGYDWDADVYNAADYGGYTKRERLIVRAKRDGKLPPKPEKLPEELRKKGWYSAVEDLIPHLEEKKTGVPQGTDERLKNSGIDYRTIDKPLYVFGRGYANKTVGHAFADELLPTLTTGGGDIIIMPDGRVLKASPRVLARVTGLPDTYKMPETDQLSHTIVGNGIPTQLTEGVIAPLLDNAIPSAERATKRESVFDVADRVSQNLEERTRAMRSDEIDRKYPNWLDGTTTDSGRHSTQVEGTRRTYNKVGDWIEKNIGKDVKILDASSGLGYGTADLKKRGFNIEDVEPYQSEERKKNNPATYSSYDDIPKDYDVIISNAVLNVIPDNWRSDVLHNMADHLKPGGIMFINTRKAGEERSIKDKIELDSPQEVLVKRNGKIASYQRFFAPKELKEWVEKELGNGYEVETANDNNSGTKGLAAVVVKKTDADIDRSVREFNPIELSNEDRQKRGDALRGAEPIDVKIKQIVKTKDMSARKAAEKWWKDNVGASRFYDTEIGLVEINKASVGSSLAHRYSQVKLDAITSLADGFNNAVYLGSMPDFSRQEGVKSHYFAYPINYNGHRNYVFCRAMQDANKNRLYVHEVFLADNIEKGNTLQTAASQPHGGITLYKDILANVLTANVTNNFETSKPRFSRKPGESIFDYASRVSEDVDRSVRERVSARDEYEKKVKSKGFQTKEALQNSMLGLQEFMYAIDHASGNKRYIEDIPDFENPILGENRLSSVNKEEMHQVAKTQFKPLMSAVAKLSGNGKESGELYDYMFAKHGLERDAVMRQREAQKEFDKYQKANPKGTKTIGDFVASLEGKDYAGLTALTAEDGRVKSIQSQIDAIDEQMKATDDQLLLRKLGGQKKRLKVDLLNAARDAADDIRKAFESNPSHDRSDINELWSRVNEVNGNTLRKLYESGMLTKEAYNDISSMYTNYIPMRGFDQTTSADAYAYLTHGDSAFNAPIKTAKGRSSKADNPIAYMQAMAESAIMQGNRNVLVKQKMLNFVRNHPSDLASVSDVWLQYDSVADEWKPVFPDNIDANDSASVVAKKMEAFEDKMKQMAEKHPDLVQRSNEAPDIPYKVVEKGQLNEHQVLVKQNGKSYIITVNGSPRAAQAANGLTNPDTDLTGAVGKVFEGAEALNRQLSSLYTTLNPDFIGSNYVRDALYSNTMVYVKEGAKYGGSFNLNFAKYNPAEMANLYARYNKGSLDTSNETHRLFLEFMQNGGETGFVNLKQIEKRKSEIAKAIKRDGEISAAQIWGGLNDAVDFANRAVENSARFAAYVTSRKSGRSVGRSVYDAKEISVNFNRKGSGRNWWKDNVGTSRFYDTEIGLVEINRASVGSSLAHRYSQVKLDVITSLAEGFNNAVYFGSMQDFSRQEGVKSHYFAYPINYNGNRNYVFCRAMQDANKSRLYVHEVFFSG